MYFVAQDVVSKSRRPSVRAARLNALFRGMGERTPLSQASGIVIPGRYLIPGAGRRGHIVPMRDHVNDFGVLAACL